MSSSLSNDFSSNQGSLSSSISPEEFKAIKSSIQTQGLSGNIKVGNPPQTFIVKVIVPNGKLSPTQAEALADKVVDMLIKSKIDLLNPDFQEAKISEAGVHLNGSKGELRTYEEEDFKTDFSHLSHLIYNADKTIHAARALLSNSDETNDESLRSASSLPTPSKDRDSLRESSSHQLVSVSETPQYQNDTQLKTPKKTGIGERFVRTIATLKENFLELFSRTKPTLAEFAKLEREAEQNNNQSKINNRDAEAKNRTEPVGATLDEESINNEPPPVESTHPMQDSPEPSISSPPISIEFNLYEPEEYSENEAQGFAPFDNSEVNSEESIKPFDMEQHQALMKDDGEIIVSSEAPSAPSLHTPASSVISPPLSKPIDNPPSSIQSSQELNENEKNISPRAGMPALDEMLKKLTKSPIQSNHSQNNRGAAQGPKNATFSPNVEENPWEDEN